MATLTRRQQAAAKRRARYEQRIAAAQTPIGRLGEGWRWLLAEARALAAPRRWHHTTTERALNGAVDDLIGLARRLNHEGSVR